MKILIVTPVYEPYYEFGGPAKSIKKLVVSLTNLGHNVTVLTQEHYPCNHSENCIYLKPTAFDIIINKIFKLNLSQYLLSNIIYLICNVYKYDIVYLNCGFYFTNSIAAILARLFNKKILFSPRGSYSSSRANDRRYAKKLLYLFDYFLWLKNSVVILLSDGERLDYLPKILNKTIIPNIYENEVSFLKPQNKLKKIIFLGRPEKNKGWDIYCQIVKRYKDKYYFIAIINYENKVDIEFNEFYINPSQDIIQSKLIESDYIFMYSGGEGMSMSIIEACSFKVIPIVNKNSIFSLIQNECIIVNSVEEVDKCFANLYKMSISENSRIFLKNCIHNYCSSKIVMNKFKDIFEHGIL